MRKFKGLSDEIFCFEPCAAGLCIGSKNPPGSFAFQGEPRMLNTVKSAEVASDSPHSGPLQFC